MRIVSLFDSSAVWSQPYADAGYEVIRVDLSLGLDVFEWQAPSGPVRGVLAAPPCDHMAGSGARWWAAKDADGRTDAGIALFHRTLELIDQMQPAWWALENPVGRVNRLVPELAEFGPWYFQPWHYGDAYTKKTGLWGTFNRNLQRRDVEPEMYESAGKRGSWQWKKLGGKSERTKRLRSITPAGFAQAFFAANP